MVRQDDAVRALFSFAGGTGHAQPMVPIADAVRAAGHDVAFCGDPRYLPDLESQGFRTFPATDRREVAPPQRLPLLEPSQQNEDRAVRDYYVGTVPRERAAHYLLLYTRWRPDVVVRDEMDFGAAVLTERLGIPHAVVQVLAAGSLVRPEVVADPWRALRAEHGLPADPDLDSLQQDLVLSPFPPSFRDPAFPLPADAHPFRPPALQGASRTALPPWWTRLADRRVVYVTLGTVFALESGDLFARLLAGLGDLPIEVVATVGPDIDPAELGRQPDHVHVHRWLPQSRLMPHVDLVVSHGGSGTILAALANGLPELVVAMGADQLRNAERIDALHLGRALHPVTTTPAQVRDATEELLADRTVRRAAQRVQQEIAGLPPPASTVPLLSRLARGRS
jgi:UDP:flavonoid glycosyltransferase YjiC (YdhE family)